VKTNEKLMPTERPKTPLKTITDLKAVPDEHAITEINGPQGKRDVIKYYHLDVNGCAIKPVNFKGYATVVSQKSYDPRD
jgi:hypothetical protein